MAESLSLLEFIRGLLSDGQLRAQFAAGPEKALDDHGLGDLSPADVYDALVLVEDTQTADFARSYDTGYDIGYARPSAPAPLDGDDHQAALRYLDEYISHNYVDDGDHLADDSVDRQVGQGGGAFEQDLDIDFVLAGGDGAGAAGGHIPGSTITTGGVDQVGSGNVRGDGSVLGVADQALTGHGNTTSFGRGDASGIEVGSGLDVGAGSAFATGGRASASGVDTSTHGSFDTENHLAVRNSFTDQRDQSISDSGNTDLDIDVDDSLNDAGRTGIENSGNVDRDHSTHDSFDAD